VSGISLAKVQVMACKGELDWLCKCLSLDQLLWITTNFSDLTVDEIRDRFDLACCVRPQPAAPNPNVRPACLDSLLTALCGDTAQAALAAADHALDAIMAVPTLVTNPVVKQLASLITIAIDAAQMACTNKQMTLGLARMICSASSLALRIVPEGGAALIPLLGPVGALFNMQGIGDAIKQCCADPSIQAAALPEWWTV